MLVPGVLALAEDSLIDDETMDLDALDRHRRPIIKSNYAASFNMIQIFFSRLSIENGFGR